MSLSLFFAKLLGLYLIIFSLLMLLRKKEIESIAKELFASKIMLYFAGSLSLLFGLIIVILHPIWEWNWKGLITLLGYIALLKGIIRIGFPNISKKIEPKMMRGYWVIFAVTAILGIYFTYEGFAHL